MRHSWHSPGAALLALAGCLGEPGGTGPTGTPAQRRVEPAPLRPEDLPAATRGALAGAIFAMRGAPETMHPGVRFAPGIAERLREPFDYRGYSAASITLLRHELAGTADPGSTSRRRSASSICSTGMRSRV